MKTRNLFFDNIYSLTCQGNAVLGAGLTAAIKLAEYGLQWMHITPAGQLDAVQSATQVAAGAVLGWAVGDRMHRDTLGTPEHRAKDLLWRCEKKIIFDPLPTLALAAFIGTAHLMLPTPDQQNSNAPLYTETMRRPPTIQTVITPV